MAIPPQGQDWPYAETAVPSAPQPLVRAVSLMCAGAVAAVAFGLAYGLTGHNGQMIGGISASGSSRTLFLVGALIAAGIEAAVWLWMAWKNKAGRPWARIVSSVLFGLLTISGIGSLSDGLPAAEVVLLIEWAIGLAAIILIWQRESTQYYRSAGAPAPPDRMNGPFSRL